ncbi:hypothetical protein WT98_02610 [Burkholderia territorii]|nr:hypothetical protein WT98_02610 [Burkholderia territorii]
MSYDDPFECTALMFARPARRASIKARDQLVSTLFALPIRRKIGAKQRKRLILRRQKTLR